MLEFLKEMINYYCWPGCPVWKFLLINFTWIVAISIIIANIIVNARKIWNELSMDNYEEEIELDDEQLIFDVSQYEDFDIMTPLYKQEKP